MKNLLKSQFVLLCLLLHLLMISTFPLDDELNVKQISNDSISLKNRTNITRITTNDAKSTNISDSSMAASAFRSQKLNFPITMKPRGFHLPKTRPAAQSIQDTELPAAQNYYSTFFPNIPPSGHSRPYYPLTEEPLIAKFLSHQAKQFPTNQHSLSAYDASILGSGDFGILRGGTFYPEEETPYNNEEASDFYYGEASNIHGGPSTEGFIQKYTYPEEQFAQFRDFADLSTPSDSAYSQYVVVYAAKNATRVAQRVNTKPKNIFEQLQEIDKEKALEEKKSKKNRSSLSTTKLKLVRTKLTKKKWIKKQPENSTNDDDDPLLALS